MTNVRMTNYVCAGYGLSRFIRHSSFVILSFAVAGCGGSGRPKTVPISGKVTINGQAPGEGGKLYFTPTQPAEGYSKRPASGSFTAAGEYRVMSWEVDDGLVPGHYTVGVVPIDPNKTAIPTKFQQGATSGLEVDVPMDQSAIEFDININSNANPNPNANPSSDPSSK